MEVDLFHKGGRRKSAEHGKYAWTLITGHWSMLDMEVDAK